jgi:hypothetical protein
MARQQLVALLAAVLVATAAAVVPLSNYGVITPRPRLIMGKRDEEYCGKKKCVNVKCDSRCPDQCFVLCPSCKTICSKFISNAIGISILTTLPLRIYLLSNINTIFCR